MQPVSQYVFNVFTIVIQLLAIPLLTMRLFSEERRSGTFEVLVSAPVSDVSITLSKYLAVLIVFLLSWLPYGLYLLVLRAEVGPFDYYPILSFSLALICSGANLVAIGLLFSSVTRIQIVAGILTAAAVTLLIFIHYIGEIVLPPTSVWSTALQDVGFIKLWTLTLRGLIPVGNLALQLSFAAFWLFLTVKVLEIRKWS